MWMRTLSNTLKGKRRHKVYVCVCDWINIYVYVHSNDFFFDTKRDVTILTSLIAASRSARYRWSTTQQTGHPMMLVVMVALSLCKPIDLVRRSFCLGEGVAESLRCCLAYICIWRPFCVFCCCFLRFVEPWSWRLIINIVRTIANINPDIYIEIYGALTNVYKELSQSNTIWRRWSCTGTQRRFAFTHFFVIKRNREEWLCSWNVANWQPINARAIFNLSSSFEIQTTSNN